ncbi:hypothetical protein J2X31_002257 [Flavobacterium arsenatis]|uniref:Carboxypeptidase regulatory-like domain-containing protein n=1 Tax=Flavobacterium arsenatis TaxID=1484332 RepID=A0ABU1TQJ8_9FLAO|nr:carboxypeptidase-like regulatory domain-containing protein [Flavobacterium arsenatis]MDR6968240.1 hypothetical protein [Flavobacterium arsenatis]
MERIQEAKLSSYLVTADGLHDAPQEIKDKIPKFGDYEKALDEKIEAIMEQREIQERDSKGTTANKYRLKDTLILSALEVSRKVRAFAIEEENEELEHLVDYSKSDLERSADTVLRDKCMVIHDAGVEYLDKMVAYGLKKPMLETLVKDIESYKAVIPKPREKVVTKKDATAELAVLFSDTDKLLKKMDKVFEMVRADHFDFYRNYKNNRLLTDPGYRKLSVMGKVKDEAGNPVANVVIEAAEAKVQVFTGVEGHFRIKTLEAGTYDFMFKKKGFLEQLVRVDVNDGERTEVDVVLKK